MRYVDPKPTRGARGGQPGPHDIFRWTRWAEHASGTLLATCLFSMIFVNRTFVRQHKLEYHNIPLIERPDPDDCVATIGTYGYCG
jgi:hypothetical protein